MVATRSLAKESYAWVMDAACAKPVQKGWLTKATKHWARSATTSSPPASPLHDQRKENPWRLTNSPTDARSSRDICRALSSDQP